MLFTMFLLSWTVLTVSFQRSPGFKCFRTMCRSSLSDDNSKYGVENSKLDISDILKEQGVRIDDLMALREKLMKGGFKFNDEEEEGDFEDGEDQLSDEDIDREFYGEERDNSSSFQSSEIDSEEKIKKREKGSSKTAIDSLAQEEEKSAANKLKSKAIKEAKLLLKLEGKSTKLPRKVESKIRPQKPRLSEAEYNKMKQREGSDIGEKRSLDDLLLTVDEVKKSMAVKSTENENEKFVVKETKKVVTAIPSEITAPRKVVQTKTSVASTTSQPVYEKLKRRVEVEVEEYDDGRTLGNFDPSNSYESLEALDDRMEELYRELDSTSDRSENTGEVAKGSSSQNPIKWRNGRLFNAKDKFYGEIKTEDSDEDEETNDSSDPDSGESISKEKKVGRTIAKSDNSKKVVVDLTGVTMKLMLEHLETSIGFDGLFEETNLRCFSVKPSVNSALKVLRQLPLEWARKKIEYLYIQSKKRQ